MNSREPEDWVLTWQTKFREWAAKDRTLTFHDVYNLVCDRRTLWVAWHHIKSNKGSKTAGVDGVTRYHVEERIGVGQFLTAIYEELRGKTYRPIPVRQKGIPKKNGKIRYLGIPALRDRVVQQALRMVLEPILEADFYEGFYAYRPGRRAQDAISEIYRFATPHSGYEWVIEGDLKACFDHVDHSPHSEPGDSPAHQPKLQPGSLRRFAPRRGSTPLKRVVAQTPSLSTLRMVSETKRP